MKVLSYLEVNQLDIDEHVEYIKWIVNNFKFEGRFVDFYAQPFKSELIRELFKGLKIEGHFIGENENIKPDYYDYLLSGKLIRIVHNNNIRTLDDFITGAVRAGIELKWRKK